MKGKCSGLLLAGLIGAYASFGSDFRGVKELAGRRVSWLSKYLVFKKKPAQANDQFTLQSNYGKIVISATSPNAAAFGLNWYLKYYCHRSMSHMGDNLSAVYPIPQVKTQVTKDASAQYRYALNYCTYNYTMSFYTWKDWEHELDWMALNGVNTMLVANGAEAVWQNVLKQLNYSEEEIKNYITGPAYTAWWLMGNIQGWGGPMQQSQIDGRKGLVQNMLKRMQALGIDPVMPAFFGMVPSDLKNKVKAHIFTQGAWGAFTRPDILDPNDPLFDRIADLFYGETKKLYGNHIRFFSGDPFHEGGTVEGVDLGRTGLSIQRAMQRNFPGAVWVLQGWQGNPRKEMLAAVDKQSILIQELFGENTKNWEDRKGYENTPFIWCTVTNFGERPGINGKLQRFADEVYRAQNSPYRSFMKGVGIMPEGINNNPVVYELVPGLAWQAGKVDVKEWIKAFTRARYGKADDRVTRAWQLLLNTAYSSELGYQEGPPENILCARPGLQVKSVSTWGSAKKAYDRDVFKKAVGLFASALPALKHCDTYRIDLINFEAQVLANKADGLYAAIVDAFTRKDRQAFSTDARAFLKLLDLSDQLLSAHPFYRLATYQRQAMALGSTTGDRENSLRNAMMLITYWGGNNRSEDNLHEYAYKQWGTLMGSFYKKRWEIYFAYLNRCLKGEQLPAPDFFQWERDWVNQHLFIAKETQTPSLEKVIASPEFR